MADRVLVIGSGARENALAWKLAQSPHVKQVMVAPGNAGTANNGKISNSAVLISNHTILAQFCKDHNIGLVIAGSEALLAAGIVDDLVAAGVRCFGPTSKAAQLGANRIFSNIFLDQHGIPTARWNAFSKSQEACNFITSADFPALVVKPSGLGPRKEVILASSREEACKAVQEIFQDNIFGDTQEKIIIEELLKGEEFTYLCFVDGITFAPMPTVQVEKQLLDGDQDPSTMGIGAYGPVPQISQVLQEKIKGTLVQHILDCMKQEDMSYAGVLQIELILTKDGVKVVNLKCHFGDPQCQVVLQLLQSDLYEVMQAVINGRLCDFTPAWTDNITAVSVVMTSEEYSECCNKGQEITGLLQAKELGLEVFHGATSIQDDKIVTSGGRVLTVTAAKKDLMSALEDVYKGLALISFQGATYIKDVGYRAMRFLGAYHMKRELQILQPVVSWFSHLNYQLQIVSDQLCKLSSDERDAMLCHIKRHGIMCEATLIYLKIQNSNLLSKYLIYRGSCGHQGNIPALFDLRASGYSDPILVSQTKGIGTKLKIAQLCNKHDMIGQDLVAMCVNDTLVQGAEPLFFLDYFAYGKLDVGIAQAVTDGIAEACKRAGCALLGSDTNEIPSICSPGEYSLIGFVVGAVERGMKLPQQERIVDGDILIGIASSGLHCQGFSLVRKILLTSSLHYFSPVPGGCGAQTLGELLLTPTRIYSKALLPVLRSGNVKAYIHVADGGLLGSFPQILLEQFSVILDARNWKIPDLFSWLQEEGRLSEGEMAQMFNCGLGAILVVQKEVAGLVLKDVQKNEDAWLVGHVIHHLAGQPRVAIKNLLEVLLQRKSSCLWNVSDVVSPLHTAHTKSKVKVAVLSSGTGTSLAALLAYTKEPASCAQVVVVIANRSAVEELKNATRAGIPTRVIDHKLFGSRSEYDGTIDQVLEEFSVELICLTGFMRVLTSNFRKKWNGKILSTYPSLSPLTKGAHKQGLPSPEKVAGCTVHFVLEDAHLEPVILQEPASVKTEDTEETLSEKVKEAESRAFPIALQLVASGMVQLGADGKTYWKCESQRLCHHQEKQYSSASYTVL